jgi:hypothetical protein
MSKVLKVKLGLIPFKIFDQVLMPSGGYLDFKKFKKSSK